MAKYCDQAICDILQVRRARTWAANVRHVQAPVSLCHCAGSPDGFGRTIRTEPPAIDEPLQAHCDLLQVGSAVRRLFHPNGVIVFHDLAHDATLQWN
jgi:hypothetical protein